MKFKILVLSLFFIPHNNFAQNIIRNTSPKDLSRVTCNNWLFTQNPGESIKVGDLDISGNQVTVEAMINRTQPYFGGYSFGGDVVSKHSDPSSANYLLRSNSAEITTSNGFFKTPAICEINLNKTYHVAFTYDGAILKFYRNGFLMSQTPATGSLFQNDFVTTIGDWAIYSAPVGSSFKGYINEVRIWNVVRTQTQLQTFMNNSLPTPTSQVGLKGYYSFDNLLNKQGNTTFNGTINGAATINNTNPNCNFVADSCFVPENIVNDYTAVEGFDICKNMLTVEDGSSYKVGDTVLLIQMKGSTIDSTNTVNFGDIINYNNAGNYEFNYILQKTGNQIYLKNKLLKSYNIPTGKVQLIRVPYYQNLNVSTKLTCLPWDGKKGGVLAVNVAQNLNMQANIDVSGRGFLGGKAVNTQQPPNCGQSQYFYPLVSNNLGARKGEGISLISDEKLNGKGKLANGGGGGNAQNAGGGGGSNGGAGGFGGYQSENCGTGLDNRGIGAVSLNYSNVLNKIFMGGGGGAGHNNKTGGFTSNGGNGGGIIIINANSINSNSYRILSNGSNALPCATAGIACSEGMGGGGAGGTILLNINTYNNFLITEQSGGNGANMIDGGNGKSGPGGGGGGGTLWISNNVIPPNVFSVLNVGQRGVCTSLGNDAWGATNGNAGNVLFNLTLPFTTTLFKPNIDSVRINYAVSNCNTFNFQGFGYTNTSAVTNYQWSFGDGATATGQNTSHTFMSSGNYNVKLLVNDVNGCRDSFLVPVTVAVVTADAGRDTAFCSNNAVVHILKGNSNATNYSWSPAALLNNSATQNPTATINATTKFYVTASNSNGCTAVDSVTITVNPLPQINTIANNSVCENDSIQLTTTGTATSYQWLPAAAVNNAAIQNPWFTGTTSTQIIVTGSDAFCKASDTVFITVNPKPLIKSIADTTLCGPQNIVLQTSGAQIYSWSPANNLSNPNIASPIFTGTAFQQYNLIVTGQDALGCKAKDTVNISVAAKPNFAKPDSFETCKNIPVQLNANNNANYLYSWSPNSSLSNGSIVNPIATPVSSTIYTVKITENICFSDTLIQVKVTVNELPIVRASKSNDIDCTQAEAQLTASGAVNYVWTPATNLSAAQTANPIAVPVNSTTYQVTGTNEKGCVNKDSVRVLVTFDKLASYYVANSFSPNGDQVNDCFGINYWNSVTELEFKIYNRYGEMVFSTKNKADCWNGKFKGRNADIGNYVYFIKANTLCGKIFKKGNLLLIR